ncbi:DeoR/GlpR family DNA-binding transcription regulator [Thaumasiovibrio subtropicus]|uniref:DeoR/GlpR family DNA-binding transcription regulator n=1 Tax=Thaumasiovibrio subtropicus TaxID=1891207 RepID=UPI000B363433|nr:DeoR/GlpR family DNA-binding transcription regulator [Thaumasiovibrio subtropicus]
MDDDKLSLRQKQICQLLEEKEKLHTDDLADHFSVSTQTIRRDINLLCEIGVARRYFGGITKNNQFSNKPFFERQATNYETKTVIAERLVEDIGAGTSLFLGFGTTAECVAQALLQHQDLRVITNNISVASILSQAPAIEVVVVGGVLRHADKDLVGYSTINAFQQFKADYAVVSCGSMDIDDGIYDYDISEADVTRCLIAQASHTLLITDSSKWVRRSQVKIAAWSSVHCLYTDYIEPDKVEMLMRDGVRCISVNDPA